MIFPVASFLKKIAVVIEFLAPDTGGEPAAADDQRPPHRAVAFDRGGEGEFVTGEGAYLFAEFAEDALRLPVGAGAAGAQNQQADA